MQQHDNICCTHPRMPVPSDACAHRMNCLPNCIKRSAEVGGHHTHLHMLLAVWGAAMLGHRRLHCGLGTTRCAPLPPPSLMQALGPLMEAERAALAEQLLERQAHDDAAAGVERSQQHAGRAGRRIIHPPIPCARYG